MYISILSIFTIKAFSEYLTRKTEQLFMPVFTASKCNNSEVERCNPDTLYGHYYHLTNLLLQVA